MNTEVKATGKKSSNASSPDMDEYEVIGKGELKQKKKYNYQTEALMFMYIPHEIHCVIKLSLKIISDKHQ